MRPRKTLKLIVQLEDHSDERFSDLDRLQVNATYQEILGVNVRKVTIPVAAGRNLAVLVEAAVRNFVLQLRGIDSTKEFIDRLTVNLRLREVMLPVLVYPILIPSLLGAILLSAHLIGGQPMNEDLQAWLRLLVGFDIIFSLLTAALADKVLVG